MEQTIQVPDGIKNIAVMIRKDWKNVYFGAEPYLSAMESINSISDRFLNDSAVSIVRYFLGNAQSWRGQTARAVKQKLNALLESNS